MMKFGYENEGFCRVVFYQIVDGHKCVYCWQQGRGDDFEFYRCSQDGEPSYEVTGWGGIPAFKLTPKNPDQTSTGRALNTYLEKLNESNDQ